MRNFYKGRLLSLVLVFMLVMASSIGVYADGDGTDLPPVITEENENAPQNDNPTQGEPGEGQKIDGQSDDGQQNNENDGKKDDQPAGEGADGNSGGNDAGNDAGQPAEGTGGSSDGQVPGDETGKKIEDEGVPTSGDTPTEKPERNPEEHNKDLESPYEEDGITLRDGFYEGWMSNWDGTHYRVIYKNDNKEYHYDLGQAPVKCTNFDESGIVCLDCGYKREFENLEEETKTVDIQAECEGFLAAAQVPEDAFGEGIDVSKVKFSAKIITLDGAEDAVKSAYGISGVDKYVVLDLEFTYEGTVIKPNKAVKIGIADLEFAPEKIAHFDENNNASDVSFEITEDGIIYFSSSEFSPYMFFTVLSEELEPTDNVLYDDEYGKGTTPNNKHFTGERTATELYSPDRYAVRLYNYNSGNGIALIAPKTENRFFVYGGENSPNFDFEFEAPENYYIAAVYQANAETQEVYKTFPVTEKYQQKVSLSLELNRMGEGEKPVVNDIVVSITAIPVEWAEDESTTTVAGATFVNYRNFADNLGSNFIFNGGHGGGSNECYPVQVYQGLANEKLVDGVFSVKNGNGNVPFPKASEYDKDDSKYSYISEFIPDAKVKFKKDTDGYWTMDSSLVRYELNSENELVTVSGEKQFRPFGQDDHFGMMLPINFSINSDGLSNGKDTIFKFSGDDDVFVYIDDTLVLDLGGIHDAIKGQINFTTGEILIQGDCASKLSSSINGTVYQNISLGDQNIYKTLYNSDVRTGIRNLSTGEHVLTVVYFERGAFLSNCRISYNFNKDEPVDIEFEGLKVKSDMSPLAGAEFRLYEDEKCEKPVEGKVATSDSNGTIKFKGLSLGVFTSSVHELPPKYFYLKETKAPDGYILPENAVWELKVIAKADGTTNKTLKAVTDDAKKVSVKTSSDSQNVKAIKNLKPGKLKISKKLSSYYKTGGTATFTFEVYYKIGDKEYSDVYPISFDNPGTKVVVDEIVIPAGVEVEVIENHTGGGYDLVRAELNGEGTVREDKSVLVTIVEDKTAEVKFTNKYNYKDIYGSISITNVFDKVTKILDRLIEVVEEVQR